MRLRKFGGWWPGVPGWEIFWDDITMHNIRTRAVEIRRADGSGFTFSRT